MSSTNESVAVVRKMSFIVTVLCALGCTAPGASATADSQRTDSSWKVSFHLSGGFAGFDRRLEVASTGEATATDARRNQRVTAQVPRDELAAIERLIVQAKPTEAQRSDTCRDCIEYEVEITSPGRHIAFHLNDASLSTSDLVPLVDALKRLQDRLLTGQRD